MQNWDYCQVRRVYVPKDNWDIRGKVPDPHLPDTTKVYTYGWYDFATGGSPRVETIQGFQGFADKMAELGREYWELVDYTQYTYEAALDGPGILHAVDTYTFKTPGGKG